MPEPQPPKRRATARPIRPGFHSAVPYAELHCRTNFSFLEGASHPDELVSRAAELGYTALAITDRNSLAGVVRAHTAAKDLALKIVVGAEVTPGDAPPVLLLATDREAYGRLCRLLTVGRRRAPKGACELTLDDIAAHTEGLLACVPLSPLLETSDAVSLRGYKEIFGDRCYALAALHRGSNDRLRLHRMSQMAAEAGVPLAASNDVHYHVPQRRFLQDVLTAIRHGQPVAELGDRIFSNAERSLKSPTQMATLFAEAPEAIRRTVEIADRCTFSLKELRYEYPSELCPPGTTPIEHLQRLTWDGARRRYPHGLPEKVRGLIEHELRLIEELRYEAFFLTVWDLVRFARSRGILCQGRGSAANSVVCYCLEVTSVAPELIDALFERFISKERDEAPDIDVDFEHERREEVLQYIYEKYGREHAGMAATVISYRLRSAIRDVGKALGLSADRVQAIAQAMKREGNPETLPTRLRMVGLNPASTIGRQLIALVEQILGFPRHLSQHVGGMVLTQRPLCEIVPIENAAMPGRTVIEWDKDDLDSLGILKVDCLSLGMLTAIRKGFSLIEQHSGKAFTLATIPADDAEVYEMISRADTVGVFQIESRAQMSMLPRLRPACYYDLVIEVAIVRPGPIQGNMVHPYLRRRDGTEAVEYPDDRIRAVLERTLGVPIFQEQAMRLAVVAAGFTPGEADQLRRAMGAWRRQGIIDKFYGKLVDGMHANGYTSDFAERLFNQIRGFGEYGFPESHAASFALLVYVSVWMKCHHPAAFTAALLNSQPLGFYSPSQLVTDARKHGVEVRPVDVNHSAWDCTLEETSTETHALRLGLRMVRGLSREHADVVVRQRADRLYQSFENFTHRTRLHNHVLKKLAKVDAFASLGLNRRSALWHALPSQRQLPLFDGLPSEEPGIELPAMPLVEQVTRDYQTAGLSLRGHPLQFVRPMLEQLQVVPTSDLAHLPEDRSYKVAGLVMFRQRPGTAKGTTFVTLEDEHGTANLIIRLGVWNRYYRIATHAVAMIAHGRLQRQDSVIHLLVDRVENLSPLLAGVESQSRDFH